MVDKIETTARRHGNGGLRIFVPAKLQHDSQNPIKPDDPIEISVDGKQMVIRKINQKQEHNRRVAIS